MPVSLERLIAEAEPSVITEELTRECIQVNGSDADLADDKRRQLPFSEVEALAFSFKNLARIANLRGLDSLTKLQLDNNRIERIENISHMVRLTWLDLSFNQITQIEGLDTLTALQDLSLFNNRITSISGLDSMAALNVLSIGNNAIAKLDSVGYLRRFNRLQAVNLAGNPVARNPNYRQAGWGAKEAHQDELLEIQEREDAAAHEAAAAAEAGAHAALMDEANLTGIEPLVDDVAASDPEWPKLSAIPGLTEPWSDVRDKWRLATEEFKLMILESHGRKKAESAEFRAALQAALDERDGEARRLITEYERARKQVAASAAAGASDAEERVLGAKVRLMSLQEALLELELDAVDAAGQLCQEFDRTFSEIAEANKLQYNSFFTQIRDLEGAFTNGLAAAAPSFLERYGASSDSPELDALPEEAQVLLGDKDALLNAIQASHDARVARIDGLEDKLVATELRRANEAAERNSEWEAKRHRDRMAEILGYLERNVQVSRCVV
ncbi:hypothetical protein MNEG_8472 [Monoraphidium neglectum]|uniref:Dynein regulatory complex subunit 3 n=1 Tax=Monoraphidium neglectum TaxID=145388 RepID=A0A0D2M820_9CHLO|nr:hypothetical protein MNEG_8472 [Monoraphidium neglectum]KIY99489.1 hypothetical protein MNEG_8472 [Monoraphidium neglectum]|eukprot:XP_013898509.1 hypothetical protein MNEG_8472 [Monoraphidium neglectum]